MCSLCEDNKEELAQQARAQAASAASETVDVSRLMSWLRDEPGVARAGCDVWADALMPELLRFFRASEDHTCV